MNGARDSTATAVGALDWAQQAACRDMETEFFFPEGQGGRSRSQRNVCRRCPVRQECLQLAMGLEVGKAKSSRFGIFGGLTPSARWNLQRDLDEKAQEAATAASAAAVHPSAAVHEPASPIAYDHGITVGSRWRSRAAKDSGRIVEVVEIGPVHVRIRRVGQDRGVAYDGDIRETRTQVRILRSRFERLAGGPSAGAGQVT